jgi:hypothetical protein
VPTAVIDIATDLLTILVILLKAFFAVTFIVMNLVNAGAMRTTSVADAIVDVCTLEVRGWWAELTSSKTGDFEAHLPILAASNSVPIFAVIRRRGAK